MDYFNSKERESQKKFASKREKIFHPLVERLAVWKVTPNQVSAVGFVLLLGGAACPASYFPLMMILVILYVVTDGIDGPLARRTGRESDGGSLVDIVIDQAGPVVLAASYTLHMPSVPAFAVLFSNSYVIAIALVVYANGKNIPMNFTVFRVKYLFYMAYALSFIIKFDVLSFFMAAGSLYYCVLIYVLLRTICRHFDALKTEGPPLS
ncbi:MAG: CDP-alcohol phosphatidyltransferase family protein [Deltaproteobacteria bacterium]|jgi:phosphatidylglycerophosphate synthase|nr:CDP-alcohol phosphatidyltransferase family protein [Deltaproteobacteria bacterium]